MSPGPAPPLDKQTFCVFRGQSQAKALVKISGDITVVEQFQGGVDVLGDRFRGYSSDCLYGVAAEDGAGAATKSAVPGIPGGKGLVVPLALVVLHDF